MRPPSIQIWTGAEPFLRPRDPDGGIGAMLATGWVERRFIDVYGGRA